MDTLKIKFREITTDCRDAEALAAFYAGLFGWQRIFGDEEYVVIAAPGTVRGSYPYLTFQYNPDYVPPVWPAEPGKQQVMEHLDLAVNDLDAAVKKAVSLGARVAPSQPEDDWTVMLDPEGHPFCLCPMKEIMDAPTFGLR